MTRVLHPLGEEGGFVEGWRGGEGGDFGRECAERSPPLRPSTLATSPIPPHPPLFTPPFNLEAPSLFFFWFVWFFCVVLVFLFLFFSCFFVGIFCVFFWLLFLLCVQHGSHPFEAPPPSPPSTLKPPFEGRAWTQPRRFVILHFHCDTYSAPVITVCSTSAFERHVESQCRRIFCRRWFLRSSGPRLRDLSVDVACVP